MSEEGASAETAKSSYVWKPWKIGGLVFARLLVAAGGLLPLSGGTESSTGASAAAPTLSDPVELPGVENDQVITFLVAAVFRTGRAACNQFAAALCGLFEPVAIELAADDKPSM